MSHLITRKQRKSPESVFKQLNVQHFSDLLSTPAPNLKDLEPVFCSLWFSDLTNVKTKHKVRK